VTAGTFYRVYDLSYDPGDGPALGPDGGPTGEASPASVSAFRLDKYVVTVGRFRQFVHALYPDGGADAALAWTPAPGSGKHAHLNGGRGLAVAPNVPTGQTYEPGWAAADDAQIAPTEANLRCPGWPDSWTWTTSVGPNENKPINCVNWYEAYAFCIWDGGFLPSEAEWEYVAAGGSEQRPYPWGPADAGVSDRYAIYGDAVGDCFYPTVGPCSGAINLAPVGTPALGAARWGQLDVTGEVTEWNLDWSSVSFAEPCRDCATLTQITPTRLGAGGSFDETVLGLLPATWEWISPTYRAAGIGIRCAREP